MVSRVECVSVCVRGIEQSLSVCGHDGVGDFVRFSFVILYLISR